MLQNLFCLHGHFKGDLFTSDDGEKYQLTNAISIGDVGYMQLKQVAPDEYKMVKFISDDYEPKK